MLPNDDPWGCTEFDAEFQGMMVRGSACFFAYGGWGLVDRARSRDATQRNEALRFLADVACGFMTALGTLALATLLYSVWAIALGTWIS